MQRSLLFHPQGCLRWDAHQRGLAKGEEKKNMEMENTLENHQNFTKKLTLLASFYLSTSFSPLLLTLLPNVALLSLLHIVFALIPKVALLIIAVSLLLVIFLESTLGMSNLVAR